MCSNHKKFAVPLLNVQRHQLFAYFVVRKRKRHIKMEWDMIEIFVFFLSLCSLSFSPHLCCLRRKDNSHCNTLSKKSQKRRIVLPCGLHVESGGEGT